MFLRENPRKEAEFFYGIKRSDFSLLLLYFRRMLEKKMGEAKRPKTLRRVSAHPEGDGASIVNNMEVPELSVPPADALRIVTVA